MAYRALYREWRPKDFSHVVGQKVYGRIVETEVVHVWAIAEADEGIADVKDDVFKEVADMHQDDETAAAPSDEKLSAAGMILFEQGKQAYTDGDFDTARQLLEAALMLNIADARDLLDEIDGIINGSQIEELYQSGLEAYRQRDYETALSWWEQTAALGDTRSQNTLGNMYYWGIQYGGEWVFDRSYEKAVKYYQMAIDNGNTDELENMISACEHLAIDFEHAGDKISAIDYYQMAADLGSSAAAAKVEELKGIPVTDESSGTKQDAEELLKLGLEAYEAENYTRALIYLEPAAEMDSPEALNTLAEMYKYYQGVPQDMEKAAALYQRSADLGDVHGQVRGEGAGGGDLPSSDPSLYPGADGRHPHSQH